MGSCKFISAPQVTIAASGTEQRIVAADVSGVISVTISNPSANTGSIYVGDSGVSTTEGVEITKGNSYTILSPEGHMIDIYNIFVDAATSGDKANVAYLLRSI